MGRHGITPPVFATWLLRMILPADEIPYLLGDFREEYVEMFSRMGRMRAWFWYWGQVLSSLPLFVKDALCWRVNMLLKNLIIAARAALKHKTASFINLAGLSLGIACCLLILLFVRFETSFDDFHEYGDRVYRLTLELANEESTQTMAYTMLPLGPALDRDFPELEAVARMSYRNALFSMADRDFRENLFYCDPDIFDIFTLPFVEGNPASALNDPFSLVISEKTARRFFGESPALGRTVTVNTKTPYTVTGVVADVPPHSHLDITILASFASLANTERVKGEYWDRIASDATYVRLARGMDPEALERKMPAFLRKYRDFEAGEDMILHLQRLRDIHFSRLGYEMARTTDPGLVAAFSVVALFILLIACINFMNLTTACSMSRAREVGMRKVAGARRSQLIGQFLTESLIMALAATAVAVLLVWLALPYFNRLIGRTLAFDPSRDLVLLPGLMALVALVGLGAGFYPAVVLSAFRPARILKGRPWASVRGRAFRTGLVVFQFAIAVIFMVSTIVVYNQLDYLRSRDVGFPADEVLVCWLWEDPEPAAVERLRRELQGHYAIRDASAAFGTPAGSSSASRTYRQEDRPQEQGLDMLTIFTDDHFLDTLGLPLVQGRNFSRDFPTDADQAYIINEAAARALGWDQPVGKRLFSDYRAEGTIIGVVRDFNFYSLRMSIEPMVLTILPEWYNSMAIRVQPDRAADAIAFLESRWPAYAPRYPLDYHLISDEFRRHYTFEQRLGTFFVCSSVLAISISCLGILGLISFTVVQRTKEVGIRKTLGASVPGLVALLVRSYVYWVLAAFVIAAPLAWVLMDDWLSSFAYRIDMGWTPFALAGAATLLIALATVIWRALRAALSNPTETLRYE
ncbi:MAG: ABC transporter permease [Acidobacteria bacterium]|nr:ABC transporter permease [Acidobacteriota bacterium]